MHPQNCANRNRFTLCAQRLFIIPPVHPVSGAHFDQGRAALLHHIRHPEAAADLDQLAARDDHAGARCQRPQHEDCGKRAVIHDQGRFSAGDLAQQLLDLPAALATLPAGHIKFQRAVILSSRQHSVLRGHAQRRTPKVGMDDHPGGVDQGSVLRADDCAQVRTGLLNELCSRWGCSAIFDLATSAV